VFGIAKIDIRNLKFEYPTFRQPPEEGSNLWCSESAYMLALYHIIAVYCLTLLFLICFICVSIYAKCCRSPKSAEAAEGEGANDAAEV
jgi:hypothetical protein